MKLTILTDGNFDQCTPCIGKVVQGEPFKNFAGDVCGYDIPVLELHRVGGTFKLEEWFDDATLFFRTGEAEELQDEYR